MPWSAVCTDSGSGNWVDVGACPFVSTDWLMLEDEGSQFTARTPPIDPRIEPRMKPPPTRALAKAKKIMTLPQKACRLGMISSVAAAAQTTKLWAYPSAAKMARRSLGVCASKSNTRLAVIANPSTMINIPATKETANARVGRLRDPPRVLGPPRVRKDTNRATTRSMTQRMRIAVRFMPLNQFTKYPSQVVIRPPMAQVSSGLLNRCPISKDREGTPNRHLPLARRNRGQWMQPDALGQALTERTHAWGHDRNLQSCARKEKSAGRQTQR